MHEISIIIPVYNVEPYLHKCLESIIAQTFTNFECILIDDGSTDNSPAICEEYAAKDSRFIVIHQKNKGVSAARNAGLDIAQGEWIGFVDSDDWCDPEMYKFLLANAKKLQADISMCGYRMISENDDVYSSSKKNRDIIMNSNEAMINLFNDNLFRVYSFNKLVNKHLFLFNNEKIRYDESIKYAEDMLLFFYLFKHANKIIYSSQIYYNYRRRINSVTIIHKKRGLTDESVTKFDVCKKMLQMEADKKIKRNILAYEGIFAASSCLLYIKDNKFQYDDNISFLKNIVKKDIIYILIIGNIKQKLYSCLVFFPFVFYLLCKIMRGKF